MRPPKIVHLADRIDDLQGGVQAAVVAIANGQARAGLAVTVVGTARPGENFTGLESLLPTVRVILCPSKGPGARVRASTTLRSLLGSPSDMDLLHVHSIWSLPPLLYAPKVAATVRTIVSSHGSLDPYDLAKHSLLKRLLGPLLVRRLLKRAEVLLATSNREALVSQTYGARVVRRVLPLPVAPPPPPSTSRDGFRSRLGIAHRAKVIVFVGRIDQKKGLRETLSALSSDELAEVELLICGAGEGAYEQVIQDHAAAVGVADRVHFLGWLDEREKADALNASDLFVLLSDNENFGISVVEAVLSGLPVAVTREVYISEDLEKAGVALVVDQSSPQAALAIGKLLDDEPRLALMRRSCSEYAKGDGRIQFAEKKFQELAYPVDSLHT